MQTEAFNYPEELFRKRVWKNHRPLADRKLLAEAVEMIRQSQRPLVVSGGGVIYSDACQTLDRFCRLTGIPECETQAGKGSLPYNHPSCLGAIGATGTSAANKYARSADLVIGVGTRYSDFTTASKTIFQNPSVKFININLFEMDAFKHGGIPLTGDARETLRELEERVDGFKVDQSISKKIANLKAEWERETDRLFHLNHMPIPAQSELIGAIWEEARPEDVILSAAGSHPGDLHKLWRARTPKSYHLEYGYSCMGYEIPAAIGVKMADPMREVFVWVGDGTYLMNPTEIVTSIQEGVKLIIIVVNNHGFGSIGGLSESVGSGGFGTRFCKRDEQSGQLVGEVLNINYAANAGSLGASVISAKTISEFAAALKKARDIETTTVIVIETDREERVPGYDSWWDVAVAEVSTNPAVQKARKEYEEMLRNEKYFL